MRKCIYHTLIAYIQKFTKWSVCTGFKINIKVHLFLCLQKLPLITYFFLHLAYQSDDYHWFHFLSLSYGPPAPPSIHWVKSQTNNRPSTLLGPQLLSPSTNEDSFAFCHAALCLSLYLSLSFFSVKTMGFRDFTCPSVLCTD